MTLDANTSLNVLWPPGGRSFKSTNNAGLVLRLSCRGHSILFPADIQVATEQELSRHAEVLASEVLVAPHHGSAEISTRDFVRAVNPAAILSSNDRTLSRKQREFDRLVEGFRLYRTNRCGAITMRISKGGEMRIETFVKTRD